MRSGSGGTREFSFGNDFNQISTAGGQNKASFELPDQFAASQFDFSQLGPATRQTDNQRNNDLELYGLASIKERTGGFSFNDQQEPYYTEKPDPLDCDYGFSYQQPRTFAEQSHRQSEFNHPQQIDFECKDGFYGFESKQPSRDDPMDFSQFSASNQLNTAQPSKPTYSIARDTNPSKSRAQKESSSIYDLFNFQDETPETFPAPKPNPSATLQRETLPSHPPSEDQPFEDSNQANERTRLPGASNSLAKLFPQRPVPQNPIAPQPLPMDLKQPPANFSTNNTLKPLSELPPFGANFNQQLMNPVKRLLPPPKPYIQPPSDPKSSKPLPLPPCLPIQAPFELPSIPKQEPANIPPFSAQPAVIRETAHREPAPKDFISMQPHLDPNKPLLAPHITRPLALPTRLSSLPMPPKQPLPPKPEDFKPSLKLSLPPTGPLCLQRNRPQTSADTSNCPPIFAKTPFGKLISSGETNFPQIRNSAAPKMDPELANSILPNEAPVREGPETAREQRGGFKPLFNVPDMQTAFRLQATDRNRGIQPSSSLLDVKTVKLNSGCSEEKRTEVHCFSNKRLSLEPKQTIASTGNSEPVMPPKLRQELKTGN
jgi:hypothetical protein